MKFIVELVVAVMTGSFILTEGRESCGGNLNFSPFRVDLEMRGFDGDNNTISRNCSGTIITDRVILTVR
jgi:hypothetical protein